MSLDILIFLFHGPSSRMSYAMAQDFSVDFDFIVTSFTKSVETETVEF